MTPFDVSSRIHEVESQSSEASARALERSFDDESRLPSLGTLAREGKEASRWHRAGLAAPLDELAFIWRTMEAASPFVMASTLWDLGWLRRPDQLLTAAEIAARTCSADKYLPLMVQWLRTLEQVGILGRVVGSPTKFVTRELDIVRIRECVDQALAVVDIHTEYPGFIEYFRTCVAHQSGLVTGSTSPHKLLFPAGNSRLVDGLYRLNPASTTQNGVVAAIVEAACRHSGDGIRILEVGAGTGATTAAILAAASWCSFEFIYTDISRFFLRRAARQFSADAARLAYAVLDIDQPPEAQGFDLHSFDLIIAVNALHTAKHIDRSLNHLVSLMSNRGVMIANETTTNTALQMITFGHFEGVCHFEDERRQSNLPFLSCTQWQRALLSAGLGSVKAIPGPYSGAGSWEQHVLLATQGSYDDA